MSLSPTGLFKKIFNKAPKEVHKSPYAERESEVTRIIEEKIPDFPKPILLHYSTDFRPSLGGYLAVDLEVPFTGQYLRVAEITNSNLTPEQEAEIIIRGMASLRK